MKTIHTYKTLWMPSILSICLLTTILLTACGPDARLDIAGMFHGSSPTIDKRIKESMAYNKKNGYATLQATAEEYHVYVCTDTHITHTQNRWREFIDAYQSDPICPVAIHLGDIIDATNEFDGIFQQTIRPAMQHQHKNDTLMAVVGNHDIYFKQWSKFVATFKTSTYYFVVVTPSGQQDLYVIYDSAEGTVGKQQLQWLTETLEWADTQQFRHIVVCTHTHFFKRDNSQTPCSNYSLEETYALLNLFSSHGVKMIWTGHDHYREITNMSSMTSIVLESMKDDDKHPAYMLVNMGEEISYQVIRMEAER